MPEDIPAPLLAAQRVWTAADEALTVWCAAHPGRLAEADRPAYDALRRVLRDATLALFAARREAGPGWDTHEQRVRVRTAAREDAAQT